MILSLTIITYSTGGVIFSRFYGEQFSSEVGRGEWLKSLRDATSSDWALLKDDQNEQVATVNEIQIFYKLLGDVVLMLAGNEEHDAFLMLELGRSLTVSIRSACGISHNKQGIATVSAERKIMQNYANLCLVVDEQIDEGDIDHLDPKIVLRLIRMRPYR